MDDKKVREYLRKRDDETREDRVKRVSDLSKVTFVKPLPKLLWEYIGEAGQLYINGHFSNVILWCASMLELALADKLIDSGKGVKEVIEPLSLDRKTRLCSEFGIITCKETEKNIDKIRDLRNAVAHAKAGKLATMAKKQTVYEDIIDSSPEILAELFLTNFGGPMKSEALESIEFTMKLMEHWYGEKASDFASSRD